MRIAVLASGHWDAAWGKKELQDIDYLVCADGGANAALLAGRLPDVIIGDLDSISAATLDTCKQKNVAIIKYPCEKDETDLQLAVEYVDRKILPQVKTDNRDIFIYGALGGRIDHILGNLSLALPYAHRGIRLRFKDPCQEVWALFGKARLQGKSGQIISLVPIAEITSVSTEGFYYQLAHGELVPGLPRGMSNVLMADTGVIEIHRGGVWVIINAMTDKG